MFAYRRKAHPKALYVTGEKHSEIQWIHWPHNLIIFCDLIVIFFAVQAWYKVKQDLPPAQETIKVVGMQWAWKFTHPGPDGLLDTADDVVAVDELHLKVNTVYHFKLGAEDVLHSFSIPVFRIKQDAIPGRVVTGWFKPTQTGTFDIQCAEICGIGHGNMGATLFVESEREHADWLDSHKQNLVHL
jgi:cytochrome c oxidase subunit 2